MVVQKLTTFFTLILLFFGLTTGLANPETPSDGDAQVNTEEEINEYKAHHLKDAYDYTLFSYGDTPRHHVGFPLPIILWDNGLKVFSSSKFHHGEEVAEAGGSYYKIFHGKIYKTDASGTINLDEEGHATNEKPLDFSITKAIVDLLIAGILILLLFSALAKAYKKGPIPTGVARFLEPLVIYVRDEIARPNIGEEKYRKYMGYLLTVFFLIWILNILGLTPLAVSVTANVTFTICLALFTFIIVNFSGNKNYWSHIFWMPGVPVLMKIFMIPIEILGILTKPFSLFIRLFANISAGHMVVMSLIALTIILKAQYGVVGSTSISFVLSLFISLIEVLVAFLQAFIFTMLSSLFIGMAVEEHEH